MTRKSVRLSNVNRRGSVGGLTETDIRHRFPQAESGAQALINRPTELHYMLAIIAGHATP